jgi:hypothetical protein
MERASLDQVGVERLVDLLLGGLAVESRTVSSAR